MKRTFVLLVSLSDANAAFGKALFERIQRNIDSTAKTAWVDSKGVGVFMQTDLSGRGVWREAFPKDLPDDQFAHFRDAILLEIGSENLAFPDTRAGAWLNSHRIGQSPESP